MDSKKGSPRKARLASKKKNPPPPRTVGNPSDRLPSSSRNPDEDASLQVPPGSATARTDADVARREARRKKRAASRGEKITGGGGGGG